MHDVDPEAINAMTKPEIGYEYRDVNVSGIIKWTAGFFIGTTVSIVATYIGFWALVGYPVREDVPFSTIPSAPNPLLQSNMATKVDIMNLRRDEQERKSTYGWIDEEKNIARIPIDTAIERIAERGIGDTGPKRDGPAVSGGTRL